SLAVLVVLAITLGAAAWGLIGIQKQNLHDQAVERADLVLSFGEASRSYARETLSPAVEKQTKVMIFEARSATFVTRGIFEALREKMPEYSFREASTNPLRPSNRADAEEEKLIRQFQENPGLKELKGLRVQDGREQFYVARPIVVKKVC